MTRLGIEVDWEQLARGEPGERAAFGAIGIRHGDLWLTEAEDERVRTVRRKVNLSAYHLAEWLVANWWRLRWEPNRASTDWALSHSLPAIGGGYVWPNVTISADGQRTLLVSRPTARRAAEPIRYLVEASISISAREFESAVDDFVSRVIERLGLQGVVGTNLNDLWSALREERLDEGAAEFRKMEALLGFDVGGAPDRVVEGLIADGAALGRNAVEELAAAEQIAGSVVTGEEIREFARAGLESRPGDGIALRPRSGRRIPGDAPAWLRGVEVARAVREQQRPGERLETETLAQFVGVRARDLSGPAAPSPIAFELDETPERSVVVLKSRSARSRRFELARLLGDRLAIREEGALRPVTRSATYRQKLQRAFAAELLCPIELLSGYMADEHGEDRIEEAADHFEVSAQTVRLQLINNGFASREEIDLEHISAGQGFPNAYPAPSRGLTARSH